MKNCFSTPFLFTLAILSGSICSMAQMPLSNDSITLQWERLDGPPAYVSIYAQNGTVLFAASEEALFTSVDTGHYWNYNEAFGQKRIVQLFANDKVVLVMTREDRVIDPENIWSSTEVHQVYRSVDGGHSWVKVLGLVEYPESFFQNIPFAFWARNDTSIYFNYFIDFGSGSGNAKTVVYRSEDMGLTWTNEWNPPLENAALLQLNRDTFSYIQYTGNSVPITGKISGNSDFSAAQTISLTATGANQNNTVSVAYFNQVFYVFKKDTVVWRTSDFGVNWQSDVLPINGTLEEVIWDDSLFFLRASDGIYRGNSDNPLMLTKIYAGAQSNAPFAKTFSPLQSGYWVNTHLNETIHAENGQNWTVRSTGLSSRVGEMRRECNTLRVQSLGPGYDKGGWYHTDQNGAGWHTHSDPENVYNLGNFGGYVFRYQPGVFRSADCGETWKYLSVPITAAPTGLVEHQGRLFLYTALDVVMQYSDDYGDTWHNGTVPVEGIRIMFSTPDYLVAIGNYKIYSSSDQGQSWDTIEVPYTMTRIFLQNNDLVGTYNNEYGDGQANIYKTADWGMTWDQTAHFTTDTCGFYYQFDANISYTTDSLIFLHHDYSLYVSGSQGINWTRISQLPFTKRYQPFCTALMQDTFIGRATRYLVNGGFLYAASESQGLWRTPLQPLMDHLYQASAIQELPDKKDGLMIYPNPSNSTIIISMPENVTGIPSASVKVFSSDGRCLIEITKRRMDLGNKLDLDVGQLPAGLYFLFIQSDRQTFRGTFTKL